MKYSMDMSLEEQVGQLLAIGFAGTSVPPEVATLIRDYHIGNIILFTRNIQSAEQVRQLTHDLQKIAREAGQRYPLLISADQENGIVQRLGTSGTYFPGNMAQGAIDSEEITYEIARATGRELRAVGINMNLAPVADVNNNPANPVIGVRSFGEDPAQVARLVTAAVRGYRAAGIVSCLKHFPGHGDTAVDSHLALPTIPYDHERLDKLELIPFKSGIAGGAESVMIAHLALPKLTGQSGLPSTLAPEIIQDLLRKKLGFSGLVVSDCMEMNAIAETVGTEQGVVLALRAGIDQVLISHRYDRQIGSREAVLAAVREGKLSMETIQQAAERVLKLKAWLAEQNKEQTNTELKSPAHLALAQEAYEHAVTLVRNNEGQLPLHMKPEQHLLIAYLQPDNYTQAIGKFRSDDTILHEVQKRYARTDYIVHPGQATAEEEQRLFQAVEQADKVIVLTVNANLNQSQAEIMKRLLESGKSLIGIAVFNPYDLLAFPSLDTYITTYEYTSPALIAAVRLLFGEIPACGKLPVSLPGLHSLNTPS